MYLVVYTRKRLLPLIRKIPMLILLAALTVPLALTAAAAYFLFASAALERQANALERKISVAREQLAAADSVSRIFTELATAARSAPAEILIDLRTPEFSRAADAARESDGGVYAVQVSSHRNRREAVRVVEELAGRLPRPLLIQQTVLGTVGWYRVLIEPFESRSAAAGYADSLLSAGVIGEVILHRLPSDWREDPALGHPVTN